MPKVDVTTFAPRHSAYLVIHLPGNSHAFPVSKLTASFALNSIPQCVCTLATGRNVSRAGEPVSSVHQFLNSDLRHLLRAQLYRRQGAGTVQLFDGYLTGLTYRKVRGQMMAVATLTHWLIDLTFSSAINSFAHPSNQDSFTGAISYPTGAGANGTAFTPIGLGFNLVAPQISQDLWGAIQRLLVFLCNNTFFQPGRKTATELDDLFALPNTRALSAIRRIEGPEYEGGDYTYGQPLPFAGGSRTLQAAAESITGALLTGWKNVSLWDVLIGQYFPAFGLALVPMVDRAIVVADTPGYKTSPDDYWRTLSANDYTGTDFKTSVTQPIRYLGVMVSAQHDRTGAYTNTSPSLGGYFRDDSDDPSGQEGTLLTVNAPDWLHRIPHTASGALGVADRSTGAARMQAVPEASSPEPETPDVRISAAELDAALVDCSQMSTRYAHLLFVRHALQGRNGPLTGRLRFDLAPGSHIRLLASDNPFLSDDGNGSPDTAAIEMYAAVSRVTIDIDAESSAASTSLQLEQIRSRAENEGMARAGLREHPFFGTNVVVGAPLIPSSDDLTDEVA